MRHWGRLVGLVATAGLGGALVVSYVVPQPTHPVALSATASDPVTTVVTRYRDRIPELMAEQDVPGLAIALVDREGPLWVEGFGHRDEGGRPVTTDTIFGVESMSKVFTATAVMQAVEAGRLDLDEPITTYLPGFTVHSAFEPHPERRITLRMLLSHTAGLTHEAPVGNNKELDRATFAEHVRSISDTWLRFPVGTGFAYSNLGIDLAGHVLERVEHRPFADVVADSLLGPVGMRRSTFDRAVISADDDRAVPQVGFVPDPPVGEAMTAAGGLYSSADDLAAFLRLQLRGGVVDGRTVLGRDAMREMRTIPPPFAGEQAGYALGVARTRWNWWEQRPLLLDHGGGGGGFVSDLWWAPRLGVGVALVTSSVDHDLQVNLPLAILDDLVRAPGVYHDRLVSLRARPAVVEPPWLRLPADMDDLVADAAMSRTDGQARRWAGHVGAYRAPDWGVLDPLDPPERFDLDEGVPYFETQQVDETEAPVRHRLVEVARDVFLADNGETLDLSGSVPRWRGLRLVRVREGPAPWQWVLLGGACVAAVAWLVGAVPRARRGRAGPTGAPGWRRGVASAGALTAVLVLANAAVLVRAPGLVDSGFLGWLELPVAVRLALHLPLALALAVPCTVLVVVAGSLSGGWSRAEHVHHAAVMVAGVVVVAHLAAWDLIGWGFDGGVP